MQEYLCQTFGAGHPKAQFSFMSDAGHYPMHRGPDFLASLIETLLETNK